MYNKRESESDKIELRQNKTLNTYKLNILNILVFI